jgi:hypothetical protein
MELGIFVLGYIVGLSTGGAILLAWAMRDNL